MSAITLSEKSKLCTVMVHYCTVHTEEASVGVTISLSSDYLLYWIQQQDTSRLSPGEAVQNRFMIQSHRLVAVEQDESIEACL